MNKETFKVNGKGVLSYDNIQSVCKHGNKEDLEVVLKKASYAREKATEKVTTMTHGFDLLNIDYKTLAVDLKALASVGATETEIKKVVGKKYQQIKEYNIEVNKVDYYDSMIEKIEEAMG